MFLTGATRKTGTHTYIFANFPSVKSNNMVDETLVYVIDVVYVKVDNELLDGLRVGFNGGLLDRLRF